MADEEQLAILVNDGPVRWNSWRKNYLNVTLNFTGAILHDKYLANALLSGIDFSGADFSRSDLTGADLSSSILVGANLTNAHLNNANVSGTNFSEATMKHTNLSGSNATGANLQNCIMEGAFWENAKLQDANLRGSSFPNAVFNGASFNENTMGLGTLSRAQRSQMKAEETAPAPPSKSNEPNMIKPTTVGYAKNIVAPAHLILKNLAIPNDLTEENRNLFLDLVRKVKELEEALATLGNDKKSLVDENRKIYQNIQQALPLWKKAWNVFVISAAGSAGLAVGGAAASAGAFAAGYTAGFVAGILHDAFAPGASCLA